MKPIEYIEEIDLNVNKDGKEWEVWSGMFNRKLRNDDPDKFAYIFSYWQVQNAKKRDGNTNDLDKQIKEIKEIIKGEK